MKARVLARLRKQTIKSRYDQKDPNEVSEMVADRSAGYDFSLIIFIIHEPKLALKLVQHEKRSRMNIVTDDWRTHTHLFLGYCLNVSIGPDLGASRFTVNVAVLDLIRDILWTFAVNLAADTECCAENLEYGTLQLLGQRFVGASHCSSNINNLIQRDGLGVLDVLLLLSVARWLFQGSDDERRGGWDN